MILSFKDKETERIFNRIKSRKLPDDIQRRAARKLTAIHEAAALQQLALIPSNHLEPLSGKRTGEWSIRINDQWRITFIPIDGGSNYIDVGIEDYH